MTNRMETGIMKIERAHRKRSAPNDRLWNNRPSLVARGGYFRLLRFCKIKMKIEPIWHLFARILLADFLRYFRKILENPQRIFSVFPFISQKIWLRNLHTTRCQIGSFIQHCTKQKTPSKSSQSLPSGSRIRPPNTHTMYPFQCTLIVIIPHPVENCQAGDTQKIRSAPWQTGWKRV